MPWHNGFPKLCDNCLRQWCPNLYSFYCTAMIREFLDLAAPPKSPPLLCAISGYVTRRRSRKTQGVEQAKESHQGHAQRIDSERPSVQGAGEVYLEKIAKGSTKDRAGEKHGRVPRQSPHVAPELRGLRNIGINAGTGVGCGSHASFACVDFRAWSKLSCFYYSNSEIGRDDCSNG